MSPLDEGRLAPKFSLLCRTCARTFAIGSFQPVCPCGGVVDAEYDLGRARIGRSGTPVDRFFDLLPLRSRSSACGPGTGRTPTVHARHLGRAIGVESLYLKDETRNPTRTTQDRMAAVAFPYLVEVGVHEFVISSTGNGATSLARVVEPSATGRLHVFVGREALARTQVPASERVLLYWVEDATFTEAHECAKAFASRHPHVVNDRGFFNLGRREGLKLAFMEAALDMPRSPDWYFQAVATGTGVYATWRGAQQLRGMGLLDCLPRLVCVQQETCAPMVNSWRAGAERIRPEDIVHQPEGIVSEILRGDPSHVYPPLRGAVDESGGRFESVGEAQIQEAGRMLLELEGLVVGAPSAAAFAAVRKMARAGDLPRQSVVLVNLTSGVRDSWPVPVPYATVRKADFLARVA